MTRAQLHDTSLEELLSAYAVAAIQHEKATEGSDYRAANMAHDGIAAIHRELAARGERALRSLVPLLSRAEPAVRHWAAAHLLLVEPSLAEPVLAALSELPGAVGLGSGMVLKEWKKGGLHFP